MKAVKAFGIVVVAIQLVGFALFVLSFYTLYTVMSTALSGDALMFTSSEDESTGELTLKIEGDLRNDGYIGADLVVEVGVLDIDEEYVGTNSTTLCLDRGERRRITLTLLIPAEEVQRWRSEKDHGFLEFAFRARTLWDLVGFSNTLKIPMGEEE